MLDRSVSILIVENDMATSHETMSVLSGMYHCTFAKTFNEAADLLSETAFNLVILSLELAEDSGQNLFTIIRGTWPNSHIIALSKSDDIRGQAAAMKHGAIYTIEKPFKIDRFLVLIKSALRSYELTRNRAVVNSDSGFARTASATPSTRVA